MNGTTIGIYSPGAMGSALGRAWLSGGARVVTTVAGRSLRTQALADGLEWLPDLASVVAAADVVVSIGPPAAAVAMAGEIASACVATGSAPLVADLNAISPTTVAEVAAALAPAGCDLIDGSISGGPPTPTTATRLYLSGGSAEVLAGLAAPGVVTTTVGDRLGTASAVKMSTAAVYKGFAALLIQSLRTANSNGVLDLVVADLSRQFGALVDHAAIQVAMAASKADRYVGEMREIAATQAAAGAGAELYVAMATVYSSVALTRLAAMTPEAAASVEDLARTLDLLTS